MSLILLGRTIRRNQEAYPGEVKCFGQGLCEVQICFDSSVRGADIEGDEYGKSWRILNMLTIIQVCRLFEYVRLNQSKFELRKVLVRNI
jgi:hypothetical protein